MYETIELITNKYNDSLIKLQSLGKEIQNNLKKERSLDEILNYLQSIQLSDEHEKKELENAVNDLIIIRGSLLNYIKKHPSQLQRIPKELIFYELYLTAVQNNASVLRVVPPDNLNRDEYANICLMAVQNNGLTLQLAASQNLSQDQYEKIGLAAWEQNHSVSCVFPKRILDAFKQKDEIVKQLLKSNYGIYDGFENRIVWSAKDALVEECKTIIVQFSIDNEEEDIYRIYEANHAANNPICVRNPKQLESLLNDINKLYKKASSSAPVSVNLAIIGHCSLKKADKGIAGFSIDEIVTFKRKYPFITQLTLLGCDTAGSEKILSIEQATKAEWEKKIRSALEKYPNLKADNLRLERLTKEILKGKSISNCGLGLMNAPLADPTTLPAQLPEELDAGYFLVKDKEKSSYSLHYLSRTSEGVTCICLSESLTQAQIEQFKALKLTATLREIDGYRLKHNKWISKKDYDSLTNEARDELEKQLVRNKTGEAVSNEIITRKSIFELSNEVVWAQNREGKIALIDNQKEIIQLMDYKARNYPKKQNNNDKPLSARHLTICSEDEDFSILKESLAGKIVQAMQVSGIKGMTIKAYRSLLFPQTLIDDNDTGRLCIAATQQPFRTTYYSQTFFRSKSTNLDLETLERKQVEANKEGRVKAINIRVP